MDELFELRPWFAPFRLQWGVDETEPSKKLLFQRVAKAHKGGLSKDSLKKVVHKVLVDGTIGGRQIKIFFDAKGRPILYSDTDDSTLSASERKQFEGFHYKDLPRLNTREHKMPILRNYCIGIRLEHRNPNASKAATASTASNSKSRSNTTRLSARSTPALQKNGRENEESTRELQGYRKMICDDILQFGGPISSAALRKYIEDNRNVELSATKWKVALRQLFGQGLLQRHIYYEPSPKLRAGEHRITSHASSAKEMVKRKC